jgi:acetylornithine/succinyldiaminopimelate/putrescine aminotransferase
MTHDTALSTYVLGNYGRYPIWPVRGQGAKVWDRDGKEYLDFAGGVAVCPLGHCDPRVVQAITEQAQTLIHVSNWYCIDKQVELARCIVEEVVKIPGKCFFSNSGAEANEGLLKLARRYGHTVRGIAKPQILTFTGSFHGRTMGAMYATAQSKIYGGFGFDPSELGYVHAPFNDLADLEVKLAANPDIVAVLLEPIQGESGVNPVSAAFLRRLQQLCRQRHMLLLLDEVQCGFGRAGELNGWQAVIPGSEILPDGISWAKAIGSGYPLGAFWVRDTLVIDAQGKEQPLNTVLGPGTHGTTYGGSPLACAVGLAVLRAIIDDDLSANAKRLGQEIATQVRSWQHPVLKEVRQLGLFIGYELNPTAMKDCAGKVPSIHCAQLLLDAGMMVTPAGPHTIRWLSPLNITHADAELGLRLLRGVLDQLKN